MPTVKQDEALVVAWVKDMWHEYKGEIIAFLAGVLFAVLVF